MSTNFRVHAALTAFEKAGDANPMRIGGLVSSASLDSQGERVLQEGLDFGQFMDRGWYNDNHGQATTDNVGYPTAATHVKKGTRLPNGKTAKRAGWWTEGYLLNTERGRKIFEMAKALASTGTRSLGFSIEGKVVERDPMSPTVIKRARVRNVAITACPVNTDTELVTLAKSLQAGAAVASPGSSAGEGFPLRTEELGGALADEEMPQWFKAYLEAEKAAKGVTKSEAIDGDPVVVDELADLTRWGVASRANIAATQEGLAKGEASLTRTEACEIVRERFPMMPHAKIEAIVDFASRRS